MTYRKRARTEHADEFTLTNTLSTTMDTQCRHNQVSMLLIHLNIGILGIIET